MEDKTFYDVHIHAFDLSHPNLRAFIGRFKLGMFLPFTPLLATVLPFFFGCIRNKVTNVVNLLAVMETDIDSVFLLLENCLRENKLLNNEGLHIGGNTYNKMVLTPLMMDFGYKRMKKDKNIHYNQPCRKPIRRQVIDVFNAMVYYHNFVYSEKYKDRFPYLKQDEQGNPTHRIFEIYPFIGINPLNYTFTEIKDLMTKYFDGYEGDREKLKENNPKFDGDIEHLTSNCAAGIKLYPPLDFDPWPEGNDDEMTKITHIYDKCVEKGIPVTAHSSEGGFNVLDNDRLKEVASFEKWEKVLTGYPTLKLNLAHFPVNDKKWYIFPTRKRLKKVLELLSVPNPELPSEPKYKNLYVDFSCRATNPAYYKALKKLISESPDDTRKILEKRILFGTDFSVHLTSIVSYNEYYTLFSDDNVFTSAEKDCFCSKNPESFLFG